MLFLDYAKRHFKELPADRWEGSSASGQPIVITEHRAGVDFSRGPWVKFKFTEGGVKKEIQGYRTWSKGDRIRSGPEGSMKEADDDQIDYSAAGDIQDGPKLLIILKFKFEQDEKPFSYRFVGKSN